MSTPGDEPELDFDYLFEYEYNKGAELPEDEGLCDGDSANASRSKT